jgi:hypothetical protein
MVTDLPEPLSPTTPSSSPGLQVKADVVHGMDFAAAGAENGLESLTSRTGAAPSAINTPRVLLLVLVILGFLALPAVLPRCPAVNCSRFPSFYQSRFAARFHHVPPAE